MINKMSITLATLLVAITLTGAEQSKLVGRTEGTGCNGPWISYTNGDIHATFCSKTPDYTAFKWVMCSNGHKDSFALENASKVYNDLQVKWKLQQTATQNLKK